MAWQISGRYMETCNCDYLCPCPLTGLAESTHGHCIFAMAFQIDRGHFDNVSLDGLSFIIVGSTPGNMGQGDWSVGLIADDKSDSKQQEALTTIVSGQAGGPPANIAPLIGNFLGVEAQPIVFAADGRSVSAGGLIDQAVEPRMGLGGEQLHLDNAGHPASNRLGLATATKSHVHAFGIDWDDVSGRNNGHCNPFNWSA